MEEALSDGAQGGEDGVGEGSEGAVEEHVLPQRRPHPALSKSPLVSTLASTAGIEECGL